MAPLLRHGHAENKTGEVNMYLWSASHKITNFIICLLVTACAAVPPTNPYTPPQSGPTAKLQVRTVSRLAGTVAIFEDAQKCSSPTALAAARVDNFFQLNADTTVPADRPISVWYGGSSQCNAFLTFEAKSAKTYVLYAQTDCTLSVQEVTENGGPVKRVRAIERTPRENPSFVNSYCTAVDLAVEMAKPPKRRISRMKMEELDALLPGSAHK